MTVISLTTMPCRAARIEPVLDSLLSQGLEVYLWLPARVARTGEQWGRIPAFFDKVRWEFVEDMGPATKLLPALKRHDTVITADDDMVYGPGWAKGLMEWAEKLPDAALAYRGRRLREGAGYKRSKIVKRPKTPVEVGLITGVRGALYRREFFAASIFDEWVLSPTNDDVIISAHLRKRGVPMMVIPMGCEVKKQSQWHTAPVHWVNQKGLTDKALREVYWCTSPK